jgi:hypothetical protein
MLPMPRTGDQGTLDCNTTLREPATRYVEPENNAHLAIECLLDVLNLTLFIADIFLVLSPFPSCRAVRVPPTMAKVSYV